MTNYKSVDDLVDDIFEDATFTKNVQKEADLTKEAIEASKTCKEHSKFCNDSPCKHSGYCPKENKNYDLTIEDAISGIKK